MIHWLSLLVAEFRTHVRTLLFAYFGGYDTFTYFCGYTVLYQLLLRSWGYLCSDSWNGSSVYSAYGEEEDMYVSSWYSSNRVFTTKKERKRM